MAIINNGTKNSLPSSQIPAGYARPTVTEFEDYEYENTLTLSILKSTVENASGAVTMTAILAALTVQIDAILAADYIASQTVTAWANLKALSNNFRASGGDDDWLTNAVTSYVATLELYVKTA